MDSVNLAVDAMFLEAEQMRASEFFHHACGSQADFSVGKVYDSVFHMKNNFMDVIGDIETMSDKVKRMLKTRYNRCKKR